VLLRTYYLQQQLPLLTLRIKGYLQTIREARTYDEGRKAAQEVIGRFEKLYPSAMQSLADDLEASLAHLLVSVKHRKYVRTTNLIQLRRGMVCQ